MTGLEEGEGRSFDFVLFIQPTGQKQGEGERAEKLKSTLDHSHRTWPQKLEKQIQTMSHWVKPHTFIKQKRKEKEERNTTEGKKKGTKKCTSSNSTHIHTENIGQTPGTTQPPTCPPSTGVYTGWRAQAFMSISLSYWAERVAGKDMRIQERQ